MALNDQAEVVNKAGDASCEVLSDLRDLYMNKIQPVEQLCQFKRMGGQMLDHASFEAPPILMMIGEQVDGSATNASNRMHSHSISLMPLNSLPRPVLFWKDFFH